MNYPRLLLAALVLWLVAEAVSVRAQENDPNCGNPPQPPPCDCQPCPPSGGGSSSGNNDDGERNLPSPACTSAGCNPYHPFSGSAERTVTDMALPYQVGNLSLHMTRHNITRWQPPAHINFDNIFGDGGNWRHSFNWTILDNGTNSFGDVSVRIVYPNGFYGNFAKDSPGAVYMTFLANTHERVWRDGTNFFLIFLDGSRYHFTQETNGLAPTYRMEAAIDPFSNRYTYVYSSGRLTRILGPNTNQFVSFEYSPLTNSQPSGNIQFSYVDGVATQVLIGGSFNGWALQDMTLSDGSNWTTTVSLTNGFHQYKFLVRYATGEVWKLDPDNNLWCYDDAESLNKNSMAIIDPYRVISSVALSDGRTSVYSYGWVENLGYVSILLTNVLYGDGTSARYSYYHPSNDVWRRPLLMTADDPHYEGPARAVRYIYQPNNVYSGQLYEERSLVNDQLFSRLTIVSSTYSRVVVNGLGETNYISYTAQTGQPAANTNGVGYVTSNEYENVVGFGQIGFLKRSWDEKRRSIEYQRTIEFGAILQVSNSARGVTRYIFTDTNTPFYLSQVIDYAGRTNTYERDAFNRTVKQVFPDGTFTTNAYNTHGLLLARRLRDGTIWRYEYDDRGRITRETDPSGESTTWTYDGHDRVSVKSNALGFATQYFYNWRGQITNTVYADGSSEKTWHDLYGLVTQRVDRAGGQTVYRYDDYSRLSAEIAPVGATNQYLFDVEGRLVARTTPLGLTVSNTYDAIGRKIRETFSSDGTYNEWHYDPDGVRTQINRLGGATLFEYNNDREIAAQRDPNGNWTRFGYDAAGNRTHVTNALNDVTEYTYDTAGRQTSTRDCEGSVVSNVYDGLGRLILQINANGIVTSNAYDAVGRLVAVWRGGLLLLSNSYNAVGWPVVRQDANGLVVTNTHDAVGRVLRTYLPDGAYSENVYSNTYLIQTIDRASRSTYYQRDVLGRVTNQLDNAANSVRYAYDAIGNLTDLYDQNGSHTRFLFDAEGRQIGKVYADGVTNHYSYDALGRLTEKLDGKSISTAYRYDSVGNLTNIDYAADADVFFAYDALNRMTEMVDGVGTSLYTYVGSCGKVQSVDGPFESDTVSYGYDAGKRLVSVTSVSSVVGYSFDALDRIISVVSDGKTNAYTYVANGRLVDSLTLGNDVVSEYSYDPLNRLTNLVHQSGGTNFASFSYTYDAANLRTSVTLDAEIGLTASRSINYGYDPIGQLTSAQGDFPGYTFDYNYDPAGNPTRQNNNGFVMSNAFNNLNQNTTSLWAGVLTVLGLANPTDGEVEVNGITAALRSAGEQIVFVATNLPVVSGTNTYTAIHTDPLGRSATSTVSAVAQNKGYGYDANGNMTNDGQFVYVWDNADRLKEVRTLSNTLVMVCSYDGLGRRRQRVMNGETNCYVYNDWAVLEVRDGSNNTMEIYTHGPDLSGTLDGAGGIGGIVNCTESGTNHWFHYDGNGNLIRATDSNSAVTSLLEYGPFGTVLTRVGPYNPRYQFSSKEFDSAVGLNYYGFRYYSPDLGRWINRDPIGEDGGYNVYAFVNNAPIYAVDPYGEAACAAVLVNPGTWVLGPWTPVIVGGVVVGWVAWEHREELWQLYKDVCDTCVEAGKEVVRKWRMRRKGQCPPCPPPPPAPPPRYDSVPPSRPHYPCPGDHMHIYWYETNQEPWPSCKCHYNMRERVVCM